MPATRNPLITALKKLFLFTDEETKAFVAAFNSLEHTMLIADAALFNGLYALAPTMTQAKILLFMKVCRYSNNNQLTANTTVGHVAEFIAGDNYDEPNIPEPPARQIPTAVGGAASTAGGSTTNGTTSTSGTSKAHYDRMQVGTVKTFSGKEEDCISWKTETLAVIG